MIDFCVTFSGAPTQKIRVVRVIRGFQLLRKKRTWGQESAPMFHHFAKHKNNNFTIISHYTSYKFTLQQIIIGITDSTDFHFLMIALVFPRQFGAHGQLLIYSQAVVKCRTEITEITEIFILHGFLLKINLKMLVKIYHRLFLSRLGKE